MLSYSFQKITALASMFICETHIVDDNGLVDYHVVSFHWGISLIKSRLNCDSPTKLKEHLATCLRPKLSSADDDTPQRPTTTTTVTRRVLSQPFSEQTATRRFQYSFASARNIREWRRLLQFCHWISEEISPTNIDQEMIIGEYHICLNSYDWI